MRASYGQDPLMIRLGGTLPVAEFFKSDLGLDTIFLAWEMPDENLHGPNEFFRLDNFDRGCAFITNLLLAWRRTAETKVTRRTEER